MKIVVLGSNGNIGIAIKLLSISISKNYDFENTFYEYILDTQKSLYRTIALKRIKNKKTIIKENIIKTRLEEISSKYSLFSEIRSSGLWFGCDLVKEKSSFEFLDIAYGEGLILVPAGSDKIRLAPALNIENEDILEGLERIEKVASKF